MSDKSFREIAGEAVGQASLCWTEQSVGEFDTTQAAQIVERLVAAHEAILARYLRYRARTSGGHSEEGNMTGGYFSNDEIARQEGIA